MTAFQRIVGNSLPRTLRINTWTCYPIMKLKDFTEEGHGVPFLLIVVMILMFLILLYFIPVECLPGYSCYNVFGSESFIQPQSLPIQ